MSNVTHPAHYNTGKIEVIEFIEDQALNYHLGNAVKYICRAGVKDSDKFAEDLEKAVWYIQRRIELESEKPRRPNDMNPKDQGCLPCSWCGANQGDLHKHGCLILNKSV